MSEFAIVQWLIASTIFFCRAILENMPARWFQARPLVALPDSGRHPGSSMDYCLRQMAILT